MSSVLAALAKLFHNRNRDGEDDNPSAQAPPPITPIPVKTAASTPVSIIPPPNVDPTVAQSPSVSPPLVGKSVMEGGQSLSPLAGLPPPPDAGIQPAPPIAAAAGQPVAPPSILAGVKPPSLLDNARARYESAIAAPIEKQSKWKDVLAYAAEAGNNIFNPNHPVAYEGFGAAKHNRAIADAAKMYQPLQQAADDDLARQGKQSAQDYQRAQVQGINSQIEDRQSDNQRADEALALNQKKQAARDTFDEWRMKNGDAKQQSYEEYQKGRLALGDKQLLSRADYNKEMMQYRRDLMAQQKDIADKHNQTTLTVAGNNQAGQNARTLNHSATQAAGIVAEMKRKMGAAQTAVTNPDGTISAAPQFTPEQIQAKVDEYLNMLPANTRKQLSH